MEIFKEYDETNKIIRISVEGHYEHEKLFLAFPEISAFARRKYCNKFLIDARKFIPELRLGEVYNLSSANDKFGILRTDIIAFIHPKEYTDLYKFCETVAYNRGWLNYKIFTDYNKGGRWLLSVGA